MNPRVKNMLIITGIIGAILIGALLIYGILVTPSRQPYRDALAQYENVGRANLTLTAAGGNLNAANATNEQFQESVETAQTALESLKTENDALAKEEVLKSGEGKDHYDTFNKSLQPYLVYNEELLESMLKVRPVMYECNNQMQGITESAASVEALRSCAARLAALEDVKNDDYATLILAFEADYTRLADVLEQMAALPDPKGADAARYSELTSERDAALEAFSTSSSDFTKSLQKNRAKVVTIDSTDLEVYLSDRSRIF